MRGHEIAHPILDAPIVGHRQRDCDRTKDRGDSEGFPKHRQRHRHRRYAKILQPLRSINHENPEVLAGEISTNLTATTVLVHYLAPHLLKVARGGTKSNLFLTSSTLAYIPLSFYPTYCASKACVAALARVLRQQLSYIPVSRENMAVVEIVPPYTDTPLDKEHREATIAMQGGASKAFAPMPLAEYVDKFFEALEAAVGPDGSVKQEIGVGYGAMGVDTWTATFGAIYEGMGVRT